MLPAYQVGTPGRLRRGPGSCRPCGTDDEYVDAVWERFLVFVDKVLLLDEYGTVEHQWYQDIGDRLYDDLVLAGVPLIYNDDLRWMTGHPDCVDMFIAAEPGHVLVHTACGTPLEPLADANAVEVVLAWYSRHVNTC